MDETTKLKKDIQELEKRIKYLEGILIGFTDNVTLKAKTRASIIVGEHVAGKPIIISATGKKYNLQTV